LLLLFFAILSDPMSFTQKAYISPVVLEDEKDPQTFMTGIKQIEVDNGNLYVRPLNGTEILVFDSNLKFRYTIGGKGDGPGKFKVNLLGFSVNNGDVWIFEEDQKISFFHGPEYVHDIRIKGLPVGIYGYSTNKFAIAESIVLLAAHPKTRHLGIAYDYAGEVVAGVGQIFPINQDALLENPALNDVLWVKGTSYWFAIFEYFPLIQIFNQQFELVSEFHFDAQSITEYSETYQDWKPRKGWRIPPELNTDAKWYKDHLWIMCHGALLKINPEKKATEKAWHFFGKGNVFPENSRLHFSAFDFLPNSHFLLIPYVPTEAGLAFTSENTD